MKIGIFSSHPIQYQVPLWRQLAANPEWETQVFYFSEHGLGETIDPGFNQVVTWDVPLLDGYPSEFLSREPMEKVNAFEIPNAKAFLANQQFDVVLLHGYMNRFARQIIRHKNTLGYRVILRGEFSEMRRRAFDWKKLLRRTYLHWFYSHVDHFCPIGLDAIDHLKTFGITQQKMTLAPYSVDDQLFENKSRLLNQQDCRDSLGIDRNSQVFLFSGKLIPRKQPLLLAEAALKLADQYPKLALIFLGSGPQHDELLRILQPKMGKRLIAPGFVNQSALGRYFKASDVFVLPSNFDTWGLVVNEAMHFGLPCIVSDMVGSRRDLVKNGETGWVFRYDSAVELAACMQRFLDQSDLAEVMGQKAHQHIQSYSIAATESGIETAIRKVMQHDVLSKR